MASINGIYTALSGMNAQRRVLDVTAHNIANEATPGYHRQRVVLQAAGTARVSAVFAGQDNIKGGVVDNGVTRSTDILAEARLLRESAAHAGTETRRNDLVQLEAMFAEPSDEGIAALLDDFWAGRSDVSTYPGNVASRNEVLQRAESVAGAFNRISSDLDQVVETTQIAITNAANDINQLAEQIAQLNTSISASATTANDLMDKRDLVMRELSELTGAVSKPANGGQIDVYIGGRNIVSGRVAHHDDGSGGTLTWELDGAPVQASESKVGAWQQTIDDVVPGLRAKLDAAANALVTEVNTLHNAGYDQFGNTGLDFFDAAGTTAATIALSADVDGIPEAIAAGAPVLPGPVAPGPLDGEQARAIAAVAHSATGPDGLYRSLITGLGVDTRTAIRQAVVQGDVLRTTEDQASAVGGVSLDEELATMMAAQRAYEASARVLTALDSMLGVLVERTGIVGR